MFFRSLFNLLKVAESTFSGQTTIFTILTEITYDLDLNPFRNVAHN